MKRNPLISAAAATYSNGLVLTKTYTKDYLLSTLQVQDPSTLAYVLNRFYASGDNINLTTITDDRTAPTAPGSAANSYGYPGTSNQLASITQASTTVRSFSYDGAGNVTADTRGSTAYNYRYNKRGRLDELTIGPTVTADYTYDGLERLAIRTTQNMSPAGTTHYLYDLAGRLLAEADDTGQTLREYVWLDDMPLAVVSDVNTGSPNLYFVHADHLDTPIRMTDGSKSVVWDAFFLPFGEVASITGPASNNLRFPGQYFLIEGGLHYNWYRHYDPTLGRYTQPDPLGFVSGPSIYAYAKGRPLTIYDPLGLLTAQFGVAASGTIFGIVVPQFGFGIAIDDKGNVGTYWYGGAGLGIGVSANAGLSLQFSDAQTICDLSKRFTNESLYAGAGAAGSVDVFSGTSDHGPVIGGGVTLGLGLGASAAVSATYTVINPLFNLRNIFQ